MPRRMGRPGLLGTAARTAVIAGTATAVSGGVHSRQAQKAEAQRANAAQQQQALVDQAASPAAAQVAAPPAPAPPAGATGGDDPIAKLKELAELKTQGLLSDEEFAAAKANLLGL